MDKKAKTVKALLKLKKRHPRNEFTIGSVIIKGYIFKEYELTKDEVEELKTVGPGAWIEIKKTKSDK